MVTKYLVYNLAAGYYRFQDLDNDKPLQSQVQNHENTVSCGEYPQEVESLMSILNRQ